MNDIDSTLLEIVGQKGAIGKVDRAQLIPTPEEWNRFTPIDNEKKILMAESIQVNGLLQPIIVRAIDPENNKFQILAGNTRNEVYGLLHEMTGEDKYLSIDAKIYWYGQINDDQAREIVSDTNYIQRGNLSNRDKAFCIHNKVEMLKKRNNRKWGTGDILTQVADQMGLKRTAVFYWNRIDKLISQFGEIFEKGGLTLKNASKIAGYPSSIQKKLYNEYMDNDIPKHGVNSLDKITSKLPAKLEKDDIEEIRYIVARISDSLTAQKTENKNAPKKVHIAKFKSSDGQYNILVRPSPSPDETCVVLYIPKDKLDKLQKDYGEYILEG